MSRAGCDVGAVTVWPLSALPLDATRRLGLSVGG